MGKTTRASSGGGDGDAPKDAAGGGDDDDSGGCWRDISNDDLVPLHQQAVLCESVKKKCGSGCCCGHRVTLAQFALRNRASCPVCGRVGTYVQDGAVAAAAEKDESENDNNLSSVCFKYGKLVYRLSVGVSATTKDDKHENNNTHHDRPWWMFWGGGGDSSSGKEASLSSSSSSSAESTRNSANSRMTTAQGRIMSVLGISHGMKIVCKGKVLYPISSYASDAERDAKERQVSQQLLELSSSSSSSSNHPSLLVIGTPSETRHAWLENEEQHLLLSRRSPQDENGNKDWWTVATAVTIHDVVQWSHWVILYSFRWTTGVLWGCWDLVRNRFFGSGVRQSNEHID